MASIIGSIMDALVVSMASWYGEINHYEEQRQWAIQRDHVYRADCLMRRILGLPHVPEDTQ